MLVKKLRIADDIVVIAESEEDLANMLDKINDILKEHYTKLNKRRLMF